VTSNDHPRKRFAQNLLPRAMYLGAPGGGAGERAFGSLVTLNYCTAEGFHGTTVRGGDLWIPLSMSQGATSEASMAPASRAAVSLLVGGRLRSGIEFSRAAAELEVISRALEQEHRSENHGVRLSPEPLSPVPGNRAIVAVFAGLLTVVVSLVLVIACANVAGVLGSRRRAGDGDRSTTGDGRRAIRIVRQLRRKRRRCSSSAAPWASRSRAARRRSSCRVCLPCRFRSTSRWRSTDA
jgi:hypothetical protein